MAPISNRGTAQFTRLSSALLDRYVAPGISEFTTADIPDMSAHDSQSSYWVSNQFLNSVCRATFRSPIAAHVQHYLRRSEASFTEHANARKATSAFLADGQSPSLYSRALLHWEYFLGQSWHACVLLRQILRQLTGDQSLKVFERDDGSVAQRLNLLYNAMKHVESRIDAGQLPESATSPVWLSNRGVECIDGHLTYDETADVLRFIAKWAEVLVDPKGADLKVKQGSPPWPP